MIKCYSGLKLKQVTRIPIVAEISDSISKNIVVIDNLKKPFLTEQFIQLTSCNRD